MVTADPREWARPPVPAAAPAAFAVRRRRHGLGSFPAGRATVAEIAVLAAALVALATWPVWVRATVGGGALLLVLMTTVRRGGRWWLADVSRHAALRVRRRRAWVAVAAAARSGDHRLISLAAVAPGALIREFRDRDTTIGVGQDEKGWYCALVVDPWRSLNGSRRSAFTVDRLARVLAETSVPVSALQVVSYAVPGPTGAVDADTPIAQSYRELLGSDPVLADQAVWVALRLEPQDAPDFAAGQSMGISGVDRVLASTIGRVGKALTEIDIPFQVLDGPALLDAVGEAIGSSGTAVDERWRLWRTAGLAQLCFEVAEWPPSGPGDFLGAFSRAPAALVSVAVVISPAEGEVGLRGLVRVGAHPSQIGPVSRFVEEVARRGGGRLRRLDGEHGPAVYATCPTGGVG